MKTNEILEMVKSTSSWSNEDIQNVINAFVSERSRRMQIETNKRMFGRK